MKIKAPFRCERVPTTTTTVFALIFWAIRGKHYHPMFLKRWLFRPCNELNCTAKNHLICSCTERGLK